MSMKKKNKIYINAVRLFEKGEIDKAISKCNEGIGENLKNSALLNFKGLLLYLKGDLKGAIATWKINSDYNDDNTAKNYIHDSKNDKERLELYIKGEKALKSIHIDEAIECFKKCRESDFNCIKTSIALGMCYIKKGDYSLASAHITKALELDKHNKDALELSKQLKKYAGINLEVAKKSYIKPITIGVIILVVICTGIFTVNKLKDSNVEKKPAINITEKEDEQSTENTDNNINEVNDKEETGKNNTNDTLVNFNEIEEAIKLKDYDKINKLINESLKEDLTEKEKALIYNAKELLSSDESIKYFYDKAFEEYMSEDYVNAIKNFSILCSYGERNYLYQHGIFYIAVCNDRLNNKNESINYYEQYYNKFFDGIYIEEVTYSLAMLYKDEDLFEAKKYAQKLQDEYPNSMYNNENISNLLE